MAATQHDTARGAPKRALDALLEPLLNETAAHLSAFPARTRLCLELALASRLIGYANARVFVAGDEADAARLIALGGAVDEAADKLCSELAGTAKAGPGDDAADD